MNEARTNARILALSLLALAGCGNGPGGATADASSGGCTGGNPTTGAIFDGTAGLTTSLGDAHVDSCAVLTSGCPNGTSGSCVALSFGADNGTYAYVIGVTVPLASGAFDCASSEQVNVSLSQTNALHETIFGGIAGRSGSQVFGSCTISNQTLDANHWAGQIDATVEDRLHGTTATLSLTGHMSGH